jgi:capsular polysaccharide biosynthesis protein
MIAGIRNRQPEPLNMKHIINVPYPLNLAASDRLMYEPYMSYERPFTKVKKLKNVFVAFSGFCLNTNGLIKECHHNNPLQLEAYLGEVATYYRSVMKHPENLITLDDDRTYVTIHHPWFNYYHWISESVFRLWLVRKQLDNLTLLLPDYYQNADFIMGSLKPFGIKNIYFIPAGKSLLVKNLYLPQIKPVCDSYNSRHVKQVSYFYRNFAAKQSYRPSMGSRIYVSRQLAGRRKVVNEDQITEILRRNKFEIFYPEKVPFLEQVAIFSQVKFLVGEHGSALTNMLFMLKGASLLELHKDKTNELDHPSPLFWYLAEALDINYYHQLCETVGKEDYFEGDYRIDPHLFECNLTTMLKSELVAC